MPQQVAADVTERNLFSRLYLDDPKDLGAFKSAPNPGNPAVPVLTRELGAVLGNVDGARSFESRRVAVDVLKKLQSTQAYEAILAARASIVTARATMTGTEAAHTDDLLARIDAAIKPYFTK